MDSDRLNDFTPDDIEGLLAFFREKLDEGTILAVVEEFHGDVESAFQVLQALAEARA